ncbi:peptidase inhibitor family I36 protein [Streptomyces sp. 8N114]|uniref:peptidase inhibitor family I36 protein n=1 Tax=Streptomyces sp. 8N114 TaxID=3457419 RepID=UPI003FD24301
MKAKRTIVLAASALSLGASSLIGFSSTAQAEPQKIQSECVVDTRFCLFEHDDYDGDSWETSTENGCQNLRSPHPNLDNKASSMANGSNDRVWLYDKAGCSGASGYSAKPKSDDEDLTNNGFDNKASSIWS